MDDQLERHWFEVIAKRGSVGSGLLRRSIFGLCFSRQYYSEALWKRFGECDDVVRVTVPIDDLRIACARWQAAGDRHAVLAPVIYGQSGQLAEQARQLAAQLKKVAKSRWLQDAPQACLEMWRLKTNAFSFEEEWRLLSYEYQPLLEDAKRIHMEVEASSIVTNVLIDSRMNPGLRSQIVQYLLEKLSRVREILPTTVNRVPESLQQLVD